MDSACPGTTSRRVRLSWRLVVWSGCITGPPEGGEREWHSTVRRYMSGQTCEQTADRPSVRTNKRTDDRSSGQPQVDHVSAPRTADRSYVRGLSASCLLLPEKDSCLSWTSPWVCLLSFFFVGSKDGPVQHRILRSCSSARFMNQRVIDIGSE